MNITPHILSIPPYLSTPWKNIASLHATPDGETFKLVVILSTGRMRVIVPHLDRTTVDAIFEAHARFGAPQVGAPQDGIVPSPFVLPTTGGGLDLLSTSMQHNPAQAHAPEMPKEVLDKITGIARVLGIEDASQLPKPEPHCNCPFCQISRAFHGGSSPAPEPKEEEVSLEELSFRNWDIAQTADKLYTVTNPLDQNEHYSVFLGKPVGCTCGNKNCEHIRAVLNS